MKIEEKIVDTEVKEVEHVQISISPSQLSPPKSNDKGKTLPLSPQLKKYLNTQ